MKAPSRPIRPIPHPSFRPWAGRRLGGYGGGVGELWLAGPASVVDGGALAGMTLDEVAWGVGAAFVGDRAMHLLGPRFPLLVKLIDAAEWLSLQVHPSDDLAAELYGAGQLGKAEAWLILDADPGTLLITGPRQGLAAANLREEIRASTIDLGHCETRLAEPGDTFCLPPGTLHAIGAGAFIYEIEQPSDLTFRISDWGRPAGPDRPLHVAESLQAVDPSRHATPVGRDWRLDGGALTVREFRLEIVPVATTAKRQPAGHSLEVVTAIRGQAVAIGDDWHEALEPYQSLVVPASIDAYRIQGDAEGLICIGSMP